MICIPTNNTKFRKVTEVVKSAMLVTDGKVRTGFHHADVL